MYSYVHHTHHCLQKVRIVDAGGLDVYDYMPWLALGDVGARLHQHIAEGSLVSFCIVAVTE